MFFFSLKKKRPYPKKNHDLEKNFFFLHQNLYFGGFFLNYFVIFQYNSIAKF